MSVRILVGSALDVLKTLPAESVHSVVTSPPYFGLRSYLPPDHPDKAHEIGLEASPAQFVAALVDVFREVWRVLRSDGTVWLNLGDSYVTRPNGPQFGRLGVQTNRHGSVSWRAAHATRSSRIAEGLKHKDLMMIPARVAIALQDDGWYVRRDIVWHKPACMPESCTDRPTTAHEYVYLLTKNVKYFYDGFAIEEPTTGNAHSRGSGVNPKAAAVGYKQKQNASFSAAVTQPVASRNARSVWSINVEPFSGGHFATMPPALAKRCIMAGTSEHGACAHCGAPYERIIEKGDPDLDAQRACGADANGHYLGQSTKSHAAAGVQDASAVKARILEGLRPKVTVGWRKPCACDPAPPVRCHVLDPFGGAGTTGLSAERIGRDATLIELNPDFASLAQRRIAQESPLFSEVTCARPAPVLESIEA